MTKIFHPNIRQPSGEICVNTLKKDWQPSHGIRHILKVIRCLLIQPFPDSALNEEAAKLLNEDYEEYSKHARMLTSIHARPQDKRSVGFSGAVEVRHLRTIAFYSLVRLHPKILFHATNRSGGLLGWRMYNVCTERGS